MNGPPPIKGIIIIHTGLWLTAECITVSIMIAPGRKSWQTAACFGPGVWCTSEVVSVNGRSKVPSTWRCLCQQFSGWLSKLEAD